MNSHLLAEVANQGFWNVGSRMGIVMLDFADKSIAQRIIDSNKKYAPSAHNYTTSVTAPTCTAQGYTTYTCTICGDVTISDYTEMIDHDYSSIVTPPTETEQGYTTYTCNLCGYSYTGDYTEVLVPHTIYFIVPEGVDKIAPMTGTSFTMPSVTGFPVTASDDAVFIGWVPMRYDNSSTAPTTIYYEGKTYYSGNSNVILYPLYLYGVTGITRTFTQFDGTNTLYIGDTILITAADYDYAISTTQDATNRVGVAITKSEDKKTIVITDEAVALFTLGFGVNGDSEPSIISFKDSHGYLYAASSDANSLCSTQTLSADASWTLSRNTSTSAMNFVAQGSNSRKYMRFNSTYNRFACYASAEQADIHMYVQTAASLDNACYTTEFACLHSTTTIIRTEPTCESDGFITDVCDHCGEELSKEILPLIGHSYEPYVTIPTCTSEGCTTYICSNCNHSYIADEISALGHQYEATVTTVTCTQDGYTNYQCTVCGDAYTDDVVSATGHVYVTETIAPTCEEDGYTSHTCSACGDSYADLITEALGHSYQTQVKAPSCTEDGYTLHVCATCDKQYTENEIAAYGHDYTVVETPPTCILSGYTTYTCTNCKTSYRSDETDPLGHSYDEGVVTTEKTCETDGVITYTCQTCSESHTETIPSGHEPVTEQIQEVSCTQDGIVIQRCTVCEKVLSTQTTAAYDHDYVAVITPPNCMEDGYSTFTCLICNDTFITSYTPAYGHDYIAQVIPSTCSEMGYTLYSCLECGNSYQEDYQPVTEHTLKYTDNGEMHKYGCVNCDYYLLEDHKWNDGEIISVGTCTSGTVTSYHCTLCNAEKLETTASGNHAPVHMPRIEPTCTENGSIEHYKCSYCNGLYTDSNCTYVLPEDYVILAATGHSYTYINNDENHTVSCTGCDYVATEEHTYIDHTCICGAVIVVEPTYEPNKNLQFTMSISAGAEMTVTYNIMGAAVNSYKDFYLEVQKEVAGSEPITTIFDVTAMTAKVNPSTGEALMYQVTYRGINAKEMGDNFSTTLYAVGDDGTIYYGSTVVDSIQSFLIGKIDASSSIPELKTMAVDMLKYGAAAQIRLGYDTETLVTADLTEEQLAYATQEIPEAINNAASTGNGASLNTSITVTSRVQLNLSCIHTAATDPDSIKCVITDAEGNLLAELPTTNKNNIMFTAIYENVGAKEMRDVINATFFEGKTVISKTISWSVESYVAQVRAKTNATEDEINMVNAMLTYGDSVAAYMRATAQ